MSSGPRWIWWVLVCCAAAALGTLAWATMHALRLEQREAEARTLSRQEESIRLALWRMETQLAPILGREAARPYYQYLSFYPADRAVTNLYEEVKPGEVMVPSPLLDSGEPHVLLHFQQAVDGVLTSPEAPTGNFRDLAESQYVTSSVVIQASERLARLNHVLDSPFVFRNPGPQTVFVARELGESEKPGQSQQRQSPALDSIAEASNREFGARQQAIGQVLKSDARERAAGAGDTQTTATGVPIAGNEPAAPPADAPAPAPAPGAAQAAPAEQQYAKKAEAAQQDRAGRPARSGAAEAPQDPANRVPVSGNTRGEGRDTVDKDTATLEAHEDDAGRESKSLADRTDKLKQGSALDDGFIAGRTILPLERKEVMIGALKPVWRKDPTSSEPTLVLLREVAVGEDRMTQGCWIDWPGLRTSLLSNVADLLPLARLEPVDESVPPAAESLGRRLAGIAAELVPGSIPASPVAAWTPMRTTLVFTWIAAILSVGVIAAALRAASDLAERRGQFVSAVTHELRTPLTTFCLYSQMLADGMVPDDASRKDYLSTLKSESQRLARIVENVLEYARLGRKRERRAAERSTVISLLDRLAPVLRARAEQSGMAFSASSTAPCATSLVQIDPLTVERILFNLVDNACKYAADGPDPRIELRADVDASWCTISVRDHGPGVHPSVLDALFKPFSRAQTLAHASTPGLGLGLALCKGLARQVGGDLRLARSDAAGTVFELSLPLHRISHTEPAKA